MNFHRWSSPVTVSNRYAKHIFYTKSTPSIPKSTFFYLKSSSSYPQKAPSSIWKALPPISKSTYFYMKSSSSYLKKHLLLYKKHSSYPKKHLLLYKKHSFYDSLHEHGRSVKMITHSYSIFLIPWTWKLTPPLNCWQSSQSHHYNPYIAQWGLSENPIP